MSSIKTLFQSNGYCKATEDLYKEIEQRIQLIEKIQLKIKKKATSLKILLEKLLERALSNLEKYKRFYSELKKRPISERIKEKLMSSRLSPTSNLCINTRKIEDFFIKTL